MALNEKYSHKDFSHKTFVDTKPEEWNDTEVVNSCFYNETPNTKVFPDGIKDVQFIDCNLDNVVVPETCTIEGGCHRLIQVQNDLEDWILDKDLKPVEPLRKAQIQRLGLSVDPRDIPLDRVAEPPVETKLKQLGAQLEADHKAVDDAADLAWRK